MNVVNQKEIRIFGIKRSGNHAIINWLLNQIPGKVVFLNNCYPAGKKLNIYDGIGTINCKGVNYWDFKRKFIFFERNPFQEQTIISYSREDKRFNQQKLKKHPKDCVIISFENKDIHQMTTMLNNDHDNLVGSSGDIFSCVIIRDPFNLFASSYKKWGKEYLTQIIPMWKQYANLFIQSQQIPVQKFEFIVYNQWFIDKNYRKTIAEKLEIKFEDTEIDSIANFGGGSSFDGISNNVKAQELKVLTRWQIFQDDEYFRSLFQDTEIIDLSSKIFGVTPEIQDFINTF
jgi:hypothetical protein